MKNSMLNLKGRIKISDAILILVLSVLPLNPSFALGETMGENNSLFATSFEFQQQVSGTVTDSNGIPLLGVTVLELGTNNGTTTDFDGNYTIAVSDGAQLQFSFIGYQDVTVNVNGASLDVTMNESASQLDEVVVIGFGERKKKDLTGSIATVNAEAIGKVVATSPQFALQGNTAGVRVVNPSGDPNAAPEIFIRGIGTWNGSSQPLYVIDGQMIEPPRDGNADVIGGLGVGTPNLFNLINPNDIESISVLKDASAAAIYGNRGANGVILITTKKGKKGKPVFEFNTLASVASIPTYDNLLNTSQYRAFAQEAYANNLNPDITIEEELYGRNADNDAIRLQNFSPQFDPQSPFFIGSDQTFNWQDDLVNNSAFTQSYDMKVSGATETVDYYISGSYLETENNIAGNDLTRYTAALNVNSRVNDWLKVGMNYKYTYQVSDLSNRGRLIGFADAPPWQPLRDANNDLGFAPALDPFGFSDSFIPANIYGQGTSENFEATRQINYSDFAINRNLGNVYVELSPLKGLTLRGSLNFDYATQNRYVRDVWSQNAIFIPGSPDPASEAPDAPNSLGGVNSRTNNIFNFQSDFTATYNKSLDKHNFNVTAGVQDQRHNREFQDLNGDNIIFLTEDPRKQGYSTDVVNNSSLRGLNRRAWFGMVGRLSYNYDSKYYLDLSFRRDASSGFDDDFRWGNFYSVAGAWTISSEKFMEDVEWVNYLKLRGGYGEAGNDEAAVGQFAFISTVSGGLTSTRFGAGPGDPLGGFQPGGVLGSLQNPALSWETVVTSYAGFDANLFNNKINMAFELYSRETKGILQAVALPPSTQLNAPLANVGAVVNRGFDLQIGYNESFGDFQFGVSGNLTFTENEVTSLFDGQPLFLDTDNDGEPDTRVEEGLPIGHIFGYQVGGIFQSQAEIDAYYANTTDVRVANTNFVAPGDLFFVDSRGAGNADGTGISRFYTNGADGVVDPQDRVPIGNPIPKWVYGLNFNLAWKGFDLYAGFYGEGDVDRYNEVRRDLELTTVGPNRLNTVLNAWTPTNTNTSIPRNVIGDPAENNREISDRFVENADFFRLNNWQIGYSLPSSVLENMGGLRQLRFYVGGQNNIYITRWSLLDPVNDNFPLPRTMNFGMNLSF